MQDYVRNKLQRMSLTAAVTSVPLTLKLRPVPQVQDQSSFGSLALLLFLRSHQLHKLYLHINKLILQWHTQRVSMLDQNCNIICF